MHLTSDANTPRRGVVWSPWAAAALLTAGCGGGGESASTPAVSGNAPTPTPSVKPNFIVVVVDDFDADSIRLLPSINSLLVQHGVSFSNSFCANPVSSPARASLLTGLHSHNHGVSRNINAFQAFLANQGGSNLATWLHDDGYRTGMVGKFMNQYVGEDAPPGWDEWHGVVFPESGSTYYNYRIRETDGTLTNYGEEEEDDYITDVLTERAMGFIRRSTESSGPFFLWLAYNAPHQPAVAASRYRHQFANARAPRTPSFNEEEMNDKPSHVRDMPLLTDEQIHDLDAYYRERLRCMLSVDEAIERIIQSLRTSGEISNTYVIFTSDNGYIQGQHRFCLSKELPYEPSIRVPLVFRGPQIPAGRSVEQLVTNVDVAPTIADLAGVTPPKASDGRSLVSLLTGAAPADWRTSVLIEHVTSSSNHVVTYSGLRTMDEKFVRYITAELELYDLRSDPDETDNQCWKVEQSVLSAWEARLAAVAQCRGAACP